MIPSARPVALAAALAGATAPPMDGTEADSVRAAALAGGTVDGLFRAGRLLPAALWNRLLAPG